MIDINLLPPEYAPKKLVSLGNLVTIFFFFLIVISLLLSSLRLMTEVNDYHGKVEYNNQQIKLYKQQVEDIRELSKRVKLLKARLSLVKELLQEKSTWSDKLFDLAQCLPQSGIWIDSLNIEHQKIVSIKTEVPASSVVVAQIAGEVTSVNKVSQFVANLEESKTFDNVVFDSASSKSAGEDSLISFKLSVQILDQNGNQ